MTWHSVRKFTVRGRKGELSDEGARWIFELTWFDIGPPRILLNTNVLEESDGGLDIGSYGVFEIALPKFLCFCDFSVLLSTPSVKTSC